MSITATLLSYANIVLTLSNYQADTRRFVVYNSKKEEVLRNLFSSDIGIEDTSNLMEHPTESGVTIVDHRVINPVTISATLYIPKDDSITLKEIEYLYLTCEPLTIRAENKIFSNMIIKDKPFKITANMLDTTMYTLNFKKALEVLPVYIGMKNAPKQSRSSVNSGVKQAKKVSETKRSMLYSTIFGGRT